MRSPILATLLLLALVACGGGEVAAEPEETTTTVETTVPPETTTTTTEEEDASSGSPADEAYGYGGGSSDTTGAPGGAGDGATLAIRDFAFESGVTAVVGEPVNVVNEDTLPHTWTANDGSFDSGTLSPGDTFEHTFDEPGTYQFFCELHSNMSGSIEVTEA